jgi:hypothetical protein
MPYDLKVIRTMIESAFTQEDLETFCSDHFQEVANQFTTGQTHTARVRQLIRYASSRGILETLLKKIEEERPAKFREFQSRLAVEETRKAERPKSKCYLIAPRTNKPRIKMLYDLLVPVIKEELRYDVEPSNIETSGNFEMLANADLVIADVTGRDPNVIYQVAVAHCLGQLVIVVGENVAFSNYQELPFDVIRLKLGPSEQLGEVLQEEVLNIKRACQTLMDNPVRKAFNAPLTELSPSSGLVLGYYGNFVRSVAYKICEIMLGTSSDVIEVGGGRVVEQDRKNIKLDIILPKRLDWASDAFIEEHLLNKKLISRAEIKSGARPRVLYALPFPGGDGCVHLADIFPTFMTVLASALDDRFSFRSPNERGALWFRAADSEIELVRRRLHALIDSRSEEITNAKGDKTLETKKVIQVLRWNDIFPELEDAFEP